MTRHRTYCVAFAPTLRAWAVLMSMVRGTVARVAPGFGDSEFVSLLTCCFGHPLRGEPLFDDTSHILKLMV